MKERTKPKKNLEEPLKFELLISFIIYQAPALQQEPDIVNGLVLCSEIA